MHNQVIDAKTKHVLDKIAREGICDSFYMAGGTALAIHFGHRMSIDLDFFSRGSFSLSSLKQNLSRLGKLTVSSEDEGTLNASLDGVKISFLRYDYVQLFTFARFENVDLADERDIAAIKIDAAFSRGSKKDFIDLYFLLRKYSLKELISFFEKKYTGIEYNKIHILKSLVFLKTLKMSLCP